MLNGDENVISKLFQCSICLHTHKDLFKLISHIKLYHSFGNSNFLCPVRGCYHISVTIEGLQAHAYRMHKNSVVDNFSQDQVLQPNCVHNNPTLDLLGNPLENELQAVPIDIAILSTICNQVENEKKDPEFEMSSDFLCENTRKHLAENFVYFYLKSRHFFLIPKSKSNQLCELVKEIVLKFADDYFLLFEQFLKEECPSIVNSYNSYKNKLNLQEMIDLSLEHLLSNKKIFEILQNKFNFVEPIEIIDEESKLKILYIPIKETLSSIIKNETLLKYIITNSYLNATNKENFFFKSTYFEEHISPLLTNKNGIFIKLYSDEIEICNPIGSAKTKHKLCVVYFTILNFPEYLSSSSDLYFLLTVFNDSNVKKKGLQFCLFPLIRELNELYFEEFQISNLIKMPVIAAFMTGDNLSIHRMLGMQTWFSSGYICRFCFIGYKQLCSIRLEELSTLFLFEYRDNSSYIEDFKSLSNGLISPSVFRSVAYINFQYFFPPDIMHDVFEGFSHVVICIILLSIIQNHNISIDYINKQLNLIKEVSIPTINKYHLQNYHLPCTSNQIIVILQYFGLLFGHLFELDDDIWILFNCHRQFLDIILSPYDSSINLEYFQSLISGQLELIYRNTGFNPKYKCKLHYICHYPEFYHYYSGLKYLWCMRGEAHHQLLKNINRHARNFKNPAYTCAKQYQISKGTYH
ncbi:hypothetical protein BOX15_Mlig000438g6 [Macrostomum lignano]|uniref:C2H2-type domain-containing protein n=1 Tax=Macrostomum lignano TaxID=282301 RepID=A0A267EGX4_9PLAT|nr:hypothetical protein BOX15_Mlig000438g6 [Macrostomum lignano]